MADDILDAIVARLRGALPDDTLRRVELETRQEFGGERCYVKRCPTRAHAATLASALAQGTPLADAIRHAGIDRSTAYRVLARPWRARSE